MGYFLTLAKFLVLIFSGLFMLVGLFELGVAVALSIWKHGYLHITIIAVAIYIGVVSLLILILGCCGAIREHHCMLLTYAVIIMILFFITLGYGIALLVQAKDNNKHLEKSSREDLQADFKHYTINSTSRIIVDYLQETGKCCGVESASEWKVVPPSCCEQKETCTVDSAFKQGCANFFYENLKQVMDILGYINIALSCAFVFTAATAVFMLVVLRNDYHHEEYD